MTVPSTPGVPLPSARHEAPSHAAMLFTVTPPAVVNEPPTTRNDPPVDGSQIAEALIMPVVSIPTG
jgi:hypothetical protein